MPSASWQHIFSVIYSTAWAPWLDLAGRQVDYRTAGEPVDAFLRVGAGVALRPPARSGLAG